MWDGASEWSLTSHLELDAALYTGHFSSWRCRFVTESKHVLLAIQQANKSKDKVRCWDKEEQLYSESPQTNKMVG